MSFNSKTSMHSTTTTTTTARATSPLFAVPAQFAPDSQRSSEELAQARTELALKLTDDAHVLPAALAEGHRQIVQRIVNLLAQGSTHLDFTGCDALACMALTPDRIGELAALAKESGSPLSQLSLPSGHRLMPAWLCAFDGDNDLERLTIQGFQGSEIDVTALGTKVQISVMDSPRLLQIKFSPQMPIPDVNGCPEARLIRRASEPAYKADAGSNTQPPTPGWRHESNKLLKACREGDVRAAKTALLQGGRVNIRPKGALTPLMYAAERGHEALVKLLLKHGANVHRILPQPALQRLKAPGEGTALMLAAANGHQRVVELLLDAGADINAIDLSREGASRRAIDFALEKGKTDMVQYLSLQGSINTATRPPYWLVDQSSFKAILNDLRHGATPSERLEAGMRKPLLLLIVIPNALQPLTQSLREFNASHPDRTQWTLRNVSELLFHWRELLEATEKTLDSKSALAKVVRDTIANIHRENIALTPESLASFSPGQLLTHPAMESTLSLKAIEQFRGDSQALEATLRALMNLGHGVNQCTSFAGLSPLQFAARHGLVGASEVLIKLGARINQSDASGRTALAKALSHDDDQATIQIVRQLLAAGANPNRAYALGDPGTWITPLCHARQPEAIQMLIRHGANPHSSIEPLCHQAKAFRLECMLALLEEGASPNGAMTTMAWAMKNAISNNMPWPMKEISSASARVLLSALLDKGLDINERHAPILRFAESSLLNMLHLPGLSHWIRSYPEDAPKFQDFMLWAWENGARFSSLPADLPVDADPMVRTLFAYFTRALPQGLAESYLASELDVAARQMHGLAQVGNLPTLMQINPPKDQVPPLVTLSARAIATRALGALTNGAAGSDASDYLQPAKSLPDLWQRTVETRLEDAINLHLPNGSTLLIDACLQGNIELAAKLILRGANLHVSGRTGATCLMAAAQGGHTLLIKLLLDNGARIHQSYATEIWTALHAAVHHGQVDAAQLLLDRGANVYVGRNVPPTFPNGAGAFMSPPITPFGLAINKAEGDPVRRLFETAFKPRQEKPEHDSDSDSEFDNLDQGAPEIDAAPSPATNLNSWIDDSDDDEEDRPRQVQ